LQNIFILIKQSDIEINIVTYGALCVALKSGLIKKLYPSPLRTENYTKYSVLLRQLVGNQIE